MLPIGNCSALGQSQGADATRVGHHGECHRGRGNRGECRAIDNMGALITRWTAKHIAAELIITARRIG